MDPEEIQLIERAKCGDELAYRELIERYQQALNHFCFGMLRDGAEAEDVVQETFIVAYQKLHTYDTSYKFSTWLFIIARRRALNVIRSTKRLVINSERLERETDEINQPTTEVLDVRRAVERLRKKYREPIEMFYWSGLSQREIADVLGLTISAVKARLTRAKEELRKELI